MEDLENVNFLTPSGAMDKLFLSKIGFKFLLFFEKREKNLFSEEKIKTIDPKEVLSDFMDFLETLTKENYEKLRKFFYDYTFFKNEETKRNEPIKELGYVNELALMFRFIVGVAVPLLEPSQEGYKKEVEEKKQEEHKENAQGINLQ